MDAKTALRRSRAAKARRRAKKKPRRQQPPTPAQIARDSLGDALLRIEKSVKLGLTCCRTKSYPEQVIGYVKQRLQAKGYRVEPSTAWYPDNQPKTHFFISWKGAGRGQKKAK